MIRQTREEINKLRREKYKKDPAKQIEQSNKWKLENPNYHTKYHTENYNGENKKNIIDKNKKYKLENKQTEQEYQKEYRENKENKEKKKKYLEEYNIKNKEKISNYQKEYQKKYNEKKAKAKTN